MEIQSVAILMATYNGEKFIKEQIDSILNQTYRNIELYIRDDNSTDNTINIVNEYVNRYPGKIVLVNDGRTAKSASINFLFLLEYVCNINKHELFMFSDQDDYWLKDKIKITVEEYNRIENKNQPILLHTDLHVVDSNLNIIENSFMKYSNLKSKYNKFNNYLVQNNVTGCTMLINKELAKLIKYDTKKIYMHDWYFALLASAFGQVKFINVPTIKYRQHGNNVIGARKSGVTFKNVFKKFKNNNTKRELNRLIEQAKEFQKIYGKSLNDINSEYLEQFIDMPSKNKFGKIRIIIKHKFYRQAFSKIVEEFMFF